MRAGEWLPCTIARSERGTRGRWRRIQALCDRLEGKAKLSQNRSAADQASAGRGLEDTGEVGARAVAELMRRLVDFASAPGGSDARMPDIHTP